MSRRRGGRLARAMLLSALLHGGAFTLVWLAARSVSAEPKMRVYAVNIVSPPPQQAGEWSPEPTAVQEPSPEPAEPEPQPQPEPPPPPEEPSPAPRPKKEPVPEKPAPKEAAKPAPKEEKPKAAPQPTRSTGARPDPSSPGGEDLDVRTEGTRFVDPAYLENIIRQVNRYFRRPAGSTTDEAEVRFWINRDGSVGDIEVVRASGSFRFRTAAMEAVEQAGLRKAFGPLPSKYPADQLPVSFTFRPAR